jgi:ankyrin repeat protein
LLLKQAKDKNPADKYGKTPFHWTVENGDLEMFKLLSENGDLEMFKLLSE